ncbi:MAG: hypothetical protein E7403_07155, partial [Ruminococcaceae bacterium]|nr:hypothetical protein [Oscillospiraceae bacterium]
MSEMLYGNTGKRDEGINISMDPSLYQKMQGRTIVPKLKSLLSDTLQEGDKNFVFIGEVVDKSGSYTVYGYNAKLETDSRGGDYGHYIAIPAAEKTVEVNFSTMGFLSEDGFAEYANQQTLNEGKRFTVTPIPSVVDDNAKKRIINNLLETFMGVRKRKNVSFSFAKTTVEEFSAKSIGILMDLMTYLPYCMRKNIAFISHICSGQKLPDSINLAAYPTECESKPHDCIGLDDASPAVSEGIFMAFVEKVFAMSLSEREAYFEKLYNEIECPAAQNGVAIRSDIYLLEVTTRELWTNGETKEAVQHIFSSVESILKIYPAYLEIAKTRLQASGQEVYDYVSGQISATEDHAALKQAYADIAALFTVCGFEFETMVVPMLRVHSAEFLKKALQDETFINVADGVFAIHPEGLDKEAAMGVVQGLFAKKADLKDLFGFYLNLKGKKYFNAEELVSVVIENAERVILSATAEFDASKDKLTKVETIYAAFQAAYTGEDFSCISEVCDTYREKFAAAASAEAVSKGSQVLYNIERESGAFHSLIDLKSSVVELAKIEVLQDAGLKIQTANSYKRVSAGLFNELKRKKHVYEDIKRLLDDLNPAVKTLHDNGVYDKDLRNGWGSEQHVLDGMYRFVTLFSAYLESVNHAQDLTKALEAYGKLRTNIQSGEPELQQIYENIAPVILFNWVHKNKKFASMAQYKKAEKALKKNPEIRISEKTEILFKENLSAINGGKQQLSPVKMIIVGVILLAVIGGLVFGGITLYNMFFNKKIEEPVQQPKAKIAQETIDAVENHLASYKADGYSDATIIVGRINEVSGEGSKLTVAVTDSFENEDFKVTEFSGQYMNKAGEALKFEAPEKPVARKTDDDKKQEQNEEAKETEKAAELEYIIVVQSKQGENNTEYVIREVWSLPNLATCDFLNIDVTSVAEEDAELYKNLVQYVGYKKGLMDAPEAKEEKKTPIAQETIDAAEAYLATYKKDDYSVVLVVGEVKADAADKTKLNIKITDALKNEEVKETDINGLFKDGDG